MKTFTGFEYLLIDAANHYGLDKELFEDRIQWVRSNIENLEAMSTDPLYCKAVRAIRKAQNHVPTGHLVGLDAVCSGIQIMSVMTGCIVGATSTGLVDPDVRADAYGICTNHMRSELPGFNIERCDAKDATMTAFYGSVKRPREIFGKDSPELGAFYTAMQKTAPGAWTLLKELTLAWNKGALSHEWQLPDGFEVKVKVMETKNVRLEVDELDGASFTYQFKQNMGSKSGQSIPANAVHSVDAYIARCMHRRLNYDPALVGYMGELLEAEVLSRALGGTSVITEHSNEVAYYCELYKASNMADVVILNCLDMSNIGQLTDAHLKGLNHAVGLMLSHKPFELVTIHDEYKALAGNMNQVRFMYKELLAELAESTVLEWILNTLYKCNGSYTKLSTNLPALIRNSNYGLC